MPASLVRVTERANAAIGSSDAPPTEGVKFVCLGYGDENNWSALSKSEQEALVAECLAYDEVLRKFGQSLGGAALQSARTAKTLRSKGARW